MYKTRLYILLCSSQIESCRIRPFLDFFCMMTGNRDDEVDEGDGGEGVDGRD